MKKLISILCICSVLSLNYNCKAIQNANKSQKGTGIGVAGGALIGGLIGGNIKGALIGAAIGGAGGAIIGRQMDKQAQKIETVLPGAEVKRVGEGIQVIFDDKSGVTFAFNSADLTTASQQNLDKIAEVFLEFPDTELMLEGHTDSVGDENYNMKLSTNRANAVSKYLQSKGVAASRMSVKGYGETAPRFDNATKEGQAKNRRVEIGIAANEDMINDAKAQKN
ncbi:OmpA family protein [Jejuia pallidilutea]|jgi:outer membrane protein OmpA-like peptidoglycan-associated protein|uniref:OmpA family protein n=1 Tax=Jejuia pallidilutea TaxID=504487 RepID=A0A090VSD5_9FLAO|nr:OmpA family protein [Jejuia pallidilutea]GAL66224.1 OmpA family protein [Jejuia pallidilutea]GAL71189.1 OmpA family protein [Jejuia pallidilutea]GAL88248.1 OmpA family protein [Jejuia pallidilutea]